MIKLVKVSKLKINFTLLSTNLSGGTRVIFEVAGRLAKRGHKVEITAVDGSHEWSKNGVHVNYIENPKWLRIARSKYVKFFTRHLNPGNDLKLDTSIKMMKPLAESIPRCDINIATQCFTAYAVDKSSFGRKFYYVQHYEPLFYSNRRHINIAKNSYRLPLTHLTVSKWLAKKMTEFNKHPFYVGSAIDHKIFYPRSTSHEEGTVISFFRGIRWKGERDVLSALKKVAAKNKIRLIAIGKEKSFKDACNNLHQLNFEVEIHEKPTDSELAKLYSRANLFVAGSWCEGFGLPPLEAMACGTPVVTTDSLGIRDFAISKVNSLVVPPKNSKAIAVAIDKILNDDNMAARLSRNGVKTAKKFTWNKVIDRIEKTFKS